MQTGNAISELSYFSVLSVKKGSATKIEWHGNQATKPIVRKPKKTMLFKSVGMNINEGSSVDLLLLSSELCSTCLTSSEIKTISSSFKNVVDFLAFSLPALFVCVWRLFRLARGNESSSYYKFTTSAISIADYLAKWAVSLKTDSLLGLITRY